MSNDFYPRSPCGERPTFIIYSIIDKCISIHALLAESDLVFTTCHPAVGVFLSTLSLRRATLQGSRCLHKCTRFLSTLSLRRATCFRALSRSLMRLFLSTLSLRRATCTPRSAGPWQAISIHALLAESDHFTGAISDYLQAFLSTLSLRRATFLLIKVLVKSHDFYPRSPCGERPLLHFRFFGFVISIHALLAESDYLTNYHFTGIFIFLSTLSLRRATGVFFLVAFKGFISIHALLAESDIKGKPASPVVSISIHALLAESDDSIDEH